MSDSAPRQPAPDDRPTPAEQAAADQTAAETEASEREKRRRLIAARLIVAGVGLTFLIVGLVEFLTKSN